MLLPLTEDEIMVLDSVRRLAERWAEGAHARDEAADGAAALHAEAAELGLFGLMVAEPTMRVSCACLGRPAPTASSL